MHFQKGLIASFILGAAHAQDTIGFGSYFTVSMSSDIWIKEAMTTLVLPQTPSPQQERLALWPGMETTNGDLIQAIAVSFENPAA